MRRSRTKATRLVTLALAGGLIGGAAAAQTVETRRARTLVVGTPSRGTRLDRGNGGRTGRTPEALPATALRVEWQTPFLGVALAHAPLTDAGGTSYVIGAQGDVIAVGRDGAELWRATSGATQPGPAALLADGSIVLASGEGYAVAVREGRVRWRTRFGRADPTHPAPLPLDDGGVVVATARDLAALDADGNERARATLPESAVAPLVSALGRVFAVTTSGTVYAWSFGDEPARVGSFGSPVDDGAALLDGHTLVAVSAGRSHLASLDLARGTSETRAIASAALWLGPPTTEAGTVRLLALTQTSEILVRFDGAGSEIAQARLSTRPVLLGQDGGPIALVPPPHVPLLVDDQGTVAFATIDEAGAVHGPVVEALPDVCPAAASAGGAGGSVAGLAPLGYGAFVVACRSGSLVAIRGQPAGSGAVR